MSEIVPADQAQGEHDLPAATPLPTRTPDWIDHVLTRLDVHGLPHVYGGPGVVGSCCPVCPPELGLVGYWRIPMVVQFTTAGVRFICRDGCDEREISDALKAPPRRAPA